MKAWGTISHSLPSEEEMFRKQDTTLKRESRRKERLKNTADVSKVLSLCLSNGREEVLVQDKQMRRPWVTLWWELPGNWHSLGFRNSRGTFPTESDCPSEATLYLSDRGWTEGSLTNNEQATPHVTEIEKLLLTCLIIYLFLWLIQTSLAQPSWAGSHIITFGFAVEMILARDCAWVGSLVRSSSIYYMVTKVHTVLHAHT